MNSLVSVVMPVYNVEDYLRECLDSVINQSYKKLQIILVDDGSTDSSGLICDQYSEKDDRITVVHQKNQGAGAAKNTGLALVKGKYLSLIDSDDSLRQLDFYEIMVEKLEQYSVDVVQCLFDKCFVNKTIQVEYKFSCGKDRVLKSRTFLKEMLYDWKYSVFWNKVFRTALLKDIRFPVGRRIDDEFFTYKLICNADTILNINDHLYNYRMRKSSVMNDKKENERIIDRVDCFVERLKYVTQMHPMLYNHFYDHLSNYIQYYLNNSEQSDSRFINSLKSAANDYPIKKYNVLYKVSNAIFLKKIMEESSIDSGELFI